MRKELSDLLNLIEEAWLDNPKLFNNGIEQQDGRDEGDVRAGQIVDAASAALRESCPDQDAEVSRLRQQIAELQNDLSYYRNR